MSDYLYVTPFFPEPGRHFGSYSYDFVRAIIRNSSHRVFVFVPGNGSDYEVDGIRVHRFVQRALPSAILPLLYHRYNASSFVSAVRRAGVDLKEVAVCHGNTAPFVIYPLCLKELNPACKTVMHYHDLDAVGLRMGVLRHFWLHKAFNYWKIRKLLRQVDVHVCVSEACLRSLMKFPNTKWSNYKDYRRLGDGLKRFGTVDIKNSYVLWNGVDTSLFSMLPESSQERQENGFTIGCIANFIEVKDHLGLVKAVHRLLPQIPGIRLELLGTNGVGHFRQNVEKYIKRNGLQDRVKILPHCIHRNLPEVYRRWDLFVMPSFFEGFGCVYLESWSCGTPFIGCEGQGIEDVLPEEARKIWLARPHDEVDLAEKILNFYKTRPPQKLTSPVDIDTLVQGFLRKIREV